MIYGNFWLSGVWCGILWFMAPYVTKSGVVLPVSKENVVLASELRFYPIRKGLQSKEFSSVFYAALYRLGFEHDRIQNDVALIGKFDTELGFSKAQVRGVYGLERGIFTSSGLFTKAARSEHADLVDMWDTGTAHVTEGGVFSDESWVAVHADGVLACEEKPSLGSIESEVEWIQANDMRWPDFSKAPSQCAITSWLRMNKPGNESLANDFIKLVWAKRFASVRRVGRGEPLKVDDSDSGTDESQHEDLMSRLWDSETNTEDKDDD